MPVIFRVLFQLKLIQFKSHFSAQQTKCYTEKLWEYSQALFSWGCFSAYVQEPVLIKHSSTIQPQQSSVFHVLNFDVQFTSVSPITIMLSITFIISPPLLCLHVTIMCLTFVTSQVYFLKILQRESYEVAMLQVKKFQRFHVSQHNSPLSVSLQHFPNLYNSSGSHYLSSQKSAE